MVGQDVAGAALEYCSSAGPGLTGLTGVRSRAPARFFFLAGGAEHRRLQLLLPEDKIAQAHVQSPLKVWSLAILSLEVEDLPGNPKVSTHTVVQTPGSRPLATRAPGLFVAPPKLRQRPVPCRSSRLAETQPCRP